MSDQESTYRHKQVNGGIRRQQQKRYEKNSLFLSHSRKETDCDCLLVHRRNESTMISLERPRQRDEYHFGFLQGFDSIAVCVASKNSLAHVSKHCQQILEDCKS
jgi:hypothetical protein